MARLEAEINKNNDAYEKLPKRKFVGARTQEYRYAQYVEDWRSKIERIGNMNYPQQAVIKKFMAN
jgi:protein TonB